METSRFNDQLKIHGYESDINIVDGASHKQMNELIFTSQSVVFKRVLAVLRGL